LNAGEKVSITGTSIGKGFQGCVKRYGFTGGRGSHGDKLGRKPGSLSGLRTQGRVFKGKRMPGHTGNAMCTISNIEVVDYIPSERIIVIKGSIPGKSGSLVELKKG
jgi:large subunit ribosomal protein L3